jgi:hypothetical protein
MGRLRSGPIVVVIKLVLVFLIPTAVFLYFILSNFVIINLPKTVIKPENTCVDTAEEERIENTFENTETFEFDKTSLLNDFIFNKAFSFVNENADLYLACVYNRASYKADKKNINVPYVRKYIGDDAGAFSIKIGLENNNHVELYAKHASVDCEPINKKDIVGNAEYQNNVPRIEIQKTPTEICEPSYEIVNSPVLIYLSTGPLFFAMFTIFGVWWGIVLLCVSVSKFAFDGQWLPK